MEQLSGGDMIVRALEDEVQRLRGEIARLQMEYAYLQVILIC